MVMVAITYPLFFGDEAQVRNYIGAPRNLRYQHGAFGARFAWDAPASWGADAAGTGARQYEYEVRELDDDGNVVPGADWDDPPAPVTSVNTQATYQATPAARHWQFRVRAQNRLGDFGPYAYEIAPFIAPEPGALRIERRFLRIGGNRLRLTS